MSNSIFHVRPLDSGKGWAIDEYDGRGAWQHSVPIGPNGAPMDKIQAQRAVFQLRRKAVNSAKTTTPVNNESSPRQRTTSDVACADAASSTDPYTLIKTAHQHWFGIGWPEDAGPVSLLQRAMELLSAPQSADTRRTPCILPRNAPEWSRLECEVSERIRALSAATSDKFNAPAELREKIYNDLVLPNVRLLAEFCLNVQIDEAIS
jgi:hypothetical protein